MNKENRGKLVFGLWGLATGIFFTAAYFLNKK
jgi:hypothetical protein